MVDQEKQPISSANISVLSDTDLSVVAIDENIQVNENGLVTFAVESTLRTRNWPFRKKMTYTICYSFVTFAAQFNSTTTSSGYFFDRMREKFNIKSEVAVLTVSLYIVGIAFGPMIFAPLSEVYGRKPAVLIPFFFSCMFTFATAISFNVSSLMTCRFFAGFFAGAPIVSAGGVLADLWDPSFRGVAFAIYACFVANGASFGPVVSSLLTNSNSSVESWRITQWFCGLGQLVLFVLMYLFTEETFENKTLQKLVTWYRIKEDKWLLHTKADTVYLDFKGMLLLHVVRPFEMLSIPVVFTMALFASYVYGLFYLMITNISTAFELSRGWTGTITEVPNVSLFLGVVFGCIGNILWALKYLEIVRSNKGEAIPEQRFPIMMMLGWMMPVGIFVFGWTCDANIHWIVPCIGVSMIGAGFITIFQGCINYLVDSYPIHAASAIAANTFMRSAFAAIFPLFAKQLFVNVGVHWGSSLIGFVALGMIPIPFVLFVVGKKLRASHWDKLQG